MDVALRIFCQGLSSAFSSLLSRNHIIVVACCVRWFCVFKNAKRAFGACIVPINPPFLEGVGGGWGGGGQLLDRSSWTGPVFRKRCSCFAMIQVSICTLYKFWL
jgi:hypothetical protein